MFLPGHSARLVAMLAIVMLVLVAAAGCGGGDDADDGPRALSKREYIEQSNELQRNAAAVFDQLDGPVAATPEEAAQYLQALEELVVGFQALEPPRDWREEHSTLIESVQVMHQAMSIVSKASARNEPVISRQLQRSADAQRDFEQAVRDINASR